MELSGSVCDSAAGIQSVVVVKVVVQSCYSAVEFVALTVVVQEVVASMLLVG